MDAPELLQIRYRVDLLNKEVASERLLMSVVHYMLYMAFGYTFYDFLTIFRYAAKFTIYVFMDIV